MERRRAVVILLSLCVVLTASALVYQDVRAQYSERQVGNLTYRYRDGALYVAGLSGSSKVDPREVIVEFWPGVTDLEAMETVEGAGAWIKKTLSPTVCIAATGDGEDVLDVLDQLIGNRYVRAAEPSVFAEFFATADDDSFPVQWNLARMAADKAWDLTTGSSSAPIAIIDTGVDIEHFDLNGNLWTNAAEDTGQSDVDDDNNGYVDDVHGWNFALDIASPCPVGHYDDKVENRWYADPHGTEVAGIACAETNSKASCSFCSGIAGVAGGWNSSGCPVMGLMIMTSADVVEALHYAVDNGAKVINVSAGFRNKPGQSGCDAVLKADTSGVMVCVALGNCCVDDSTTWWPGDMDSTVGVSAISFSDTLAAYSNYGNRNDLGAPSINDSHCSANCDSGTSCPVATVEKGLTTTWYSEPETQYGEGCGGNTWTPVEEKENHNPDPFAFPR